jgi:hypothetical protein
MPWASARAHDMAKGKKNNPIDRQFCAFTYAMMESPAFRVLSQSAYRVLWRICIECAHHGGNDNGKLPVTYQDFEDYGIDRHSISPAIRELVALGFLEVTQAGRPGRGDSRWPNLFRVPWLHCKSNPYPTHAWRKFMTTEEAELFARAARKSSAKPRKQFPVSAPRLLVVQ